MELLLPDAASDVELVSRELGLRDAMLERLPRALDRIVFARTVSEATGEAHCATSLHCGNNDGHEQEIFGEEGSVSSGEEE
jgi:hypothetical protein